MPAPKQPEYLSQATEQKSILYGGGNVLPVPDPTTLTSIAIQREISNLKDIIFTRLDGMDRALALFQENITRVPTDTDKQIQHLQELHEEKFESVNTQFKERDTRAEQTGRDSKVAVDAALQAQKEAAAKSETSMIKQFDNIMLLIQSSTKSTDDKVSDVKDRITSIEGRSVGSNHQDRKMSDSASMIFGLVGMVVAIISVIVLVTRISPK